MLRKQFSPNSLSRRSYLVGMLCLAFLLLASSAFQQPDQPILGLEGRVFTGTFPDINSVIDGDTINDVSVKIFDIKHDGAVQKLWPGVELRVDSIYAYNKIRIRGIDSPEMEPRNGNRTGKSIKIKLEKQRAVAAKEFLAELITKSNPGKTTNLTVKITGPGPGYFYGRIVADVWVNNQEGKEVSVAKELIRAGHAVVYERGNPHDWGAE